MIDWHVLESDSEAEVPRVLPADWRRAVQHSAGAFIRRDDLRVLISVEQEGNGLRRWLHVSLSRVGRLPSWEDVREVKDIFVGRARKAIQVLPPEDEYINENPHVLHLWCCLNDDVLPDFRRKGTL